MKLDDWLKAENKTSAEFARLSGIGDRQAVHKYRHGERFPTPENLQRIRKATGGAVTANDFADQHAPDAPLPTPKRSAKAAKANRRAKAAAASRTMTEDEAALIAAAVQARTVKAPATPKRRAKRAKAAAAPTPETAEATTPPREEAA